MQLALCHQYAIVRHISEGRHLQTGFALPVNTVGIRVPCLRKRGGYSAVIESLYAVYTKKYKKSSRMRQPVLTKLKKIPLARQHPQLQHAVEKAGLF